MLYLAKENKAEYVPIRVIAAELEISFHFLVKIFQTLSRQGLLKSEKGPKGGVGLLVEANKISIEQIIIAIDGRKLFENCVLNFESCSDEAPCALHHIWGDVRDQLQTSLASLDLTALSHLIVTENKRL